MDESCCKLLKGFNQMKTVAEIFGIDIKTAVLYQKALTHPSYTQDLGLSATESYERLEFLGDSVLLLSKLNNNFH